MSYKSRSASRRRTMTQEDIEKELVWQVIGNIILAVILLYWGMSLLTY